MTTNLQRRKDGWAWDIHGSEELEINGTGDHVHLCASSFTFSKLNIIEKRTCLQNCTFSVLNSTGFSIYNSFHHSSRSSSELHRLPDSPFLPCLVWNTKQRSVCVSTIVGHLLVFDLQLDNQPLSWRILLVLFFLSAKGYAR